MKSNQINILAFTVLGNLEQIDQAQETRLARQLRSNIWKPNGSYRIYFYLTLVHAVPAAHFDMGARPYSNAACNFAAANTVAEPLGEHHEEILPAAGAGVKRLCPRDIVQASVSASPPRVPRRRSCTLRLWGRVTRDRGKRHRAEEPFECLTIQRLAKRARLLSVTPTRAAMFAYSASCVAAASRISGRVVL